MAVNVLNVFYHVPKLCEFFSYGARCASSRLGSIETLGLNSAWSLHCNVNFDPVLDRLNALHFNLSELMGSFPQSLIDLNLSTLF